VECTPRRRLAVPSAAFQGKLRQFATFCFVFVMKEKGEQTLERTAKGT
jgi:hypothetical protein